MNYHRVQTVQVLDSLRNVNRHFHFERQRQKSGEEAKEEEKKIGYKQYTIGEK
tara:strand:- start:47 stop:205 length:159 start_codon:yes stop_codon:yes gene_type:complete